VQQGEQLVVATQEGNVAARSGPLEEVEVSKPSLSDGKASKIRDFVTACKLYIRYGKSQ